MECHFCGMEVPFFEEHRVKVIVGEGYAKYDGRPKTPTGGRLGQPFWRNRSYSKTEVVVACPAHALGKTLVSWPGKERFEQRSRKHG